MSKRAITVSFQVKAERLDDFLELQSGHAAATMEEEDGCIQFDVLINDADAEAIASGDAETVNVLMVEMYRDEEAKALHMKSPRIPALGEKYKDMIESREVKHATVHNV